MAAVDSTGRKGHSSKQKRRSRSSDGRAREKEMGRRRRRRRGGSEGGGRSDLQSPVSELGEGSREARDRRSRRRKRETQSLPRDALRNYDDSETERGTERGTRRERRSGRSKSRGRKSRSEERVRSARGQEEEREEPAVEERVEERMEEEERVNLEQGEEREEPAVEERVEERQEEEVEEEEVEEGVDLGIEEIDDEVFLPIPSPNQKLPTPKQLWAVENDENWDVATEYRELRTERSRDDDGSENSETELIEHRRDDDAQSESAAVIDPVSQRKPFSFLTSTLSLEQLGDNESESGGSQSDGSVSAASISGLSLAPAGAGGHGAKVLPGPWLTPSQQRVAQVAGSRRPESRTERGGGRGAVS